MASSTYDRPTVGRDLARRISSRCSIVAITSLVPISPLSLFPASVSPPSLLARSNQAALAADDVSSPLLPIGPATAESWLSEAISAVATMPWGESGSAEAESIVEVLAPFRARVEATPATVAGAEFVRSLDCIEALTDEKPAPTAMPHDPGLLFLLARELSVPVPESWIGRLIEELDDSRASGRIVGGPSWDSLSLAWIEWLEKTAVDVRRAALREQLVRAQSGEFSIACRCALIGALGRCGTIGDLRTLRRELLRPEEEIRTFASRAIRELTAGRIRRGEAAGVAQVWREEWQRRPWDRGLSLAQARTLLSQGSELDAVQRSLAELLEGAAEDRSSGALADVLAAHAGRAWIAHLRGERPADLERLTALPRPPQEEEDSLIAALLCGRLVRYFVADDAECAALLDALEQDWVDHPAGVEHCPLDRAYFGPCGPAELEEAIRRTPHATAFRERLKRLIDRMEFGSALHGYGLLQRSDDAEERRASWIYLRLSRLQLLDGDLQLANTELSARAVRLERTETWVNRQLLVETLFLSCQVLRRERDGAAAFQAASSALSVARELREALRMDVATEVAEGRLVIPPPEQILIRDGDFAGPLESRAQSTLATLHALFEADRVAASRASHRAGALRVWDDYHWMEAALDHARRGRATQARRCLACVEVARDQLYDRACVLALLGDREPAMACLLDHLAAQCPCEASRNHEVNGLFWDPDLDSIRGDRAFPKNDGG